MDGQEIVDRLNARGPHFYGTTFVELPIIGTWMSRIFSRPFVLSRSLHNFYTVLSFSCSCTNRCSSMCVDAMEHCSIPIELIRSGQTPRSYIALTTFSRSARSTDENRRCRGHRPSTRHGRRRPPAADRSPV